MPDATISIALTAAWIGFVHTILGPDHYVPFVAMSKAGRWSLPRTLLVTLLCGIGHVLSSVVLGAIGIALGVAVFRLEHIESVRGMLAGWMLLGFGIAYTAWGVHRAIRNRPHTHLHVHADGSMHTHEHTHVSDHAHAHVSPHAPTPDHSSADSNAPTPSKVMTVWVLFTIFVFGPCEPLIPLIMYPAARGSLWGVVFVTLVFGAVTLATMLAVVAAACLGLGQFGLHGMHRFAHATAGIAIATCGAAVLLGA